MTTTYIDLLRHGLPEGEDCFRGHTDFALTEQGFQQMRSAIKESQHYDLIITSPLQRCQRFATYLAKLRSLPLVENRDFMEINFGHWDGKSKQEVWDNEEQNLTQFWSSPWEYTPPNGEPLDSYDSRIEQAWNEVLRKHKGKRILLVTHGGVIKQILRQLLGMPKDAAYLQRLAFPYGSRVSLSIYHDDLGKLWPTVHWPSSDQY